MQLSRLAVLSEDEVAEIHAASLEVLWQKGVRILSRSVLDFLSNFDGVEIDAARNIAKFRPDLAEKQIALAPATFELFDRTGVNCITVGGSNYHCVNGHCAVYQYDLSSGTRHPISLPEIEQHALIADHLDAFRIIGIQGTPHEVEPGSAFVTAACATLKHSDKPFHYTPEFARENKAIQEMVGVLGGDEALRLKPSVLVQHTSMSPLCWPAEIAESLVENARNRIPMVILSAPYSGVTAPYTLAGQLALINAEVLSGVIMAQLVGSGCPVVWGDSCASFDMSSLNVLIGSPEASLLRIASAQMAEHYDLPCFTTAPDSDAHVPDQQAAWEKFESVFCAFAAGVHVIANAGMFSSGVCVSLEQLVIDAEIYSVCRRLLDGIKVERETIALRSLLDVDHCGDYLLEDSTLNNLRSGEHARPTVSSRQGYEKWSGLGGLSVEKEAAAKAEEILRLSPTNQISEEEQRALQDILSHC